MMNGMYVKQDGQFYTIYTPQGIVVAQVYMGADGQVIQDVEVLKVITKALQKRWRVSN